MKPYLFLSGLLLMCQMAFGTSMNYQINQLLVKEKILLLKHRKKDKTVRIRLGTKVKIKRHKGKRIKGILTDLTEDAAIVDGQVIPLANIKKIKPYFPRSIKRQLSILLSFLGGLVAFAFVGFPLLQLIAFFVAIFAFPPIAFLLLIALLFQSATLTIPLGKLLIGFALGMNLTILGFILSKKDRKTYNTKNWQIYSTKS